jgi:two-component system, LytTR family, response regulator
MSMVSFLQNSFSELSEREGELENPIRVFVSERDFVSRKLICAILEREPDVVFQCVDDSDVFSAIQACAPDLVILDAQTTAMKRAANWEALGVKSPPATILTSYDRTSLMPLASAAADLLIKPFDVEQFENAMEIARSKIANTRARSNDVHEFRSNNDPMADQRRFLQRFAAESQGKIVLIKIRDVLWLQSFGNHIRVHSAGATHLVRSTMRSIQSLLDPTVFLRIHRNAIVNLDHVTEFFLPAQGNMFVTLDNGVSLPLRRASRGSLRKLLKQHSLA